MHSLRLTWTLVLTLGACFAQTPPTEVQGCFQRAENKPVNLTTAREACWRAYYTTIQKPDDFSEADSEFFKRFQTQRLGHIPPVSGHRNRSEVRTLSKTQYTNFVNAFKELYSSGTLATFGRLHGHEIFRKHRGAAFLPWHRVFLVAFEEELRKVDPTVSLPYWDYTMDYYAFKPTESVMWTNCFLGNNHGNIEEGPFADWYGGYSINIRRNAGRDGGDCPPRLIRRRDIDDILNYCHFQNITTGSNSDYYANKHNLELHHDGVHDWVGGDMGEVPYSSYDPVFWMHHAFIDYIWEQFRKRQQTSDCNVNPETDFRRDNDSSLYPEQNLLNTAHSAMHGFEHLQLMDGLWLNWTQAFYSYLDTPSCPDCGNSPYLYCNKDLDPQYPDGVCVSRTKEFCTERTQRDTTTETEEVTLVRPPPHCQSVHRHKGLPGDGRSRDLPLERCKEILIEELSEEEIPIQTAVCSGVDLTSGAAFISSLIMAVTVIIIIHA